MSYKKISREELEVVLQDHGLWLKSNGTEGNRANLGKIKIEKGFPLHFGGLPFSLTGVVLRGADLSGADLSGADLSGADLSGADLSGADLSDANLSGANLRGSDLHSSDLSRCNLSFAILVNANSCKATLSGAILNDADISGVNLRGANLSGTNLSGANLRKTDLRGATLRDANIISVDLSDADLSDADLSGANIKEVRVTRRKDLKHAKVDALNGFIFAYEEAAKNRQQREKRAEQLFDVEEKGTLVFTLPEIFNPLRVARGLRLVSTLVEGVRLAYTVDEPTGREIGEMIANPELWNTVDDKYAAELVSITRNSPYIAVISVISGLAALIFGVIKIHQKERELYLKELAYEQKQRELAQKDRELAQKDRAIDHEARRLALDEQRFEEEQKRGGDQPVEALPVTLSPSLISSVYFSVLRDEIKDMSRELLGNFRSEVDYPKERLDLAVRVVSGFQREWLALVPKGWPPPEINGEPMPMPMHSDDYDDTPK